MEFIHRAYDPDATIAAIATPIGEGGIAIIRISGKDAIIIADKVFSGPVTAYATHTAHIGFVINHKNEKIDQALLLVMRAPASYTGEDTVEIQCHGGLIATRKVLETVIKAGARHASPGEFTFKAFMNGKLDLAQAEAVQTLIGAKSEKAFQLAQEHLQGGLSTKIKSLQETLISIAAIFEAYTDFPEEGLEITMESEIRSQLQDVLFQIEQMIASFHEGRTLSYGIKLCLVGLPNAGKSSLLNALLDEERAIVTPTPGTTRDILKEEMTLNGIPIQLMDTAGIRKTSNHIEKEGVRRSYQAMQQADLILLVLDAGKKRAVKTNDFIQSIPMDKTIVVWNKIDLPQQRITPIGAVPHVAVSAKEKIGLADLKSKIEEFIGSRKNLANDEIIISVERHQEALIQAQGHIISALEGLEARISYEFRVFSIRQALIELGRIIGNDISEDILTAIFSKFCIGK